MKLSHAARAAVCLLMIGACAELFAPRAGAWPPPPKFTELQIVNNTQVEIFDIRIEIDLSDPSDRSQILVPTNEIPYGVVINRLPAGRTVVVSTGAGTQGIEGVARVRLKGDAQAPLGQPLGQDVVIEAKRDNFDTSNPELEWSGFCAKAPSGGTDYQPRLEFRMNTSLNKLEAHLSGKWRWDSEWATQVVESSGWFPGGGGGGGGGGGAQQNGGG